VLLTGSDGSLLINAYQCFVQLLYIMCMRVMCAAVLSCGMALCVLCTGCTCTEQHHTRYRCALRTGTVREMQITSVQLRRVRHGVSFAVRMCFAQQRLQTTRKGRTVLDNVCRVVVFSRMSSDLVSESIKIRPIFSMVAKYVGYLLKDMHTVLCGPNKCRQGEHVLDQLQTPPHTGVQLHVM
jgi:hypothetical protein